MCYVVRHCKVRMKTINNQKYVWRKTIRTATLVKFSIHLVNIVNMEAIKPELYQFVCGRLKQQEGIFYQLEPHKAVAEVSNIGSL